METLATPHSEQILVSCRYKEKTIYVEKSVQNQKTKKKQKKYHMVQSTIQQKP